MAKIFRRTLKSAKVKARLIIMVYKWMTINKHIDIYMTLKERTHDRVEWTKELEQCRDLEEAVQNKK